MSTTTLIPWTPPQWSAAPLTSLVDQNGRIYIFDGVMSLNHRLEVVATENPVLTGANIVDHAYLRPLRVRMRLSMSDTMSSYAPGMWGALGAGKSANAFRTLQALAIQRVTFTVSTRLQTYWPMIIREIEAQDDVNTRNSLNATVEFEQLLMAVTDTAPVASARPDATATASGGSVSGSSPVPNMPQAYQAEGYNYPPSGGVSSSYTGGYPGSVIPPDIQQVVVTSNPAQSFLAGLTVDGSPLSLLLNLAWIPSSGCWNMDIFDASADPILLGIPLVAGDYPAANLLAQYGYLGIGSLFVLRNGQGEASQPGADNLATAFTLLWGDSL